jgi:hypothetical protein
MQLALRMNSLAAAQWHVFSPKDIADTITQIDFRQLRAGAAAGDAAQALQRPEALAQLCGDDAVVQPLLAVGRHRGAQAEPPGAPRRR